MSTNYLSNQRLVIFSISPVNKVKLLVFLSAITFVTIYNYSFKKTINLKQKIDENHNKIISISSASSLIQDYNLKLKKIEESSHSDYYDRRLLFEIVNNFCRDNSLQIVEFHPEIIKKLNKFDLITNELNIIGDFKAMVRLVWLIEHDLHLGQIVSAKYELIEDKRTKKKYLTGNFFIQNYHKKTM
jgi:hypothetical protein